MAYTIYIGNRNYSSWSLRGWLLVRATGAPFDEKLVSLNANEQSGVYKQFSPSGLVPCLVDNDSVTPGLPVEGKKEAPDGGGGPTVVWDTFAIAEYLAEQHPALWPADRRARAWARSIAAEMHSGFRTLRGEMAMCVRERVDVRPWSDALQRDLHRVSAIWSETRRRFGQTSAQTSGDTSGQTSGGGKLLFGDFTAADAFYAPVVFRFRTYDFHPVGDAGDYMEAMLDHPYMKEWEQGALAESERVEADEPRVIYRDKISA